jgi:hypothetical protein
MNARMNTGTAARQVSLAHRGLMNVADAAGVSLRCDRGAVWLTLDNDPRDIVLEAGQEFRTDQHRHLLVYALETSTVSLQVPLRDIAHPVRRTLPRLLTQPA